MVLGGFKGAVHPNGEEGADIHEKDIIVFHAQIGSVAETNDDGMAERQSEKGTSFCKTNVPKNVF